MQLSQRLLKPRSCECRITSFSSVLFKKCTIWHKNVLFFNILVPFEHFIFHPWNILGELSNFPVQEKTKDFFFTRKSEKFVLQQIKY